MSQTTGKTEKKIEAVLFDLDGTIVDTNELIIQSFLSCLQGIVPPEFGREQIIPIMGQTLVSQLQQFSGREQVEDLIAGYRAYNMAHHDDMVSLFPGVLEVVPMLKSAGLKLGVVTTKMRPTTERALKLLGLYDYMDTIVTLDDVEHAKPHPEPVEKALRALDVAPEQAIMVGDSTVDIGSALAAGSYAVGVSWSLKGEAPLREAGAHRIIHDMRGLLPLCGLEG
ncbi:pyrophosphatase PpaX [Cohnella sp. 56]|uniref:pyrophosphatase PpaX n=1 Tax=Cohnella sp. 56 TaxID=3113722 RepID=UPI0030E9FC17